MLPEVVEECYGENNDSSCHREHLLRSILSNIECFADMLVHQQNGQKPGQISRLIPVKILAVKTSLPVSPT